MNDFNAFSSRNFTFFFVLNGRIEESFIHLKANKQNIFSVVSFTDPNLPNLTINQTKPKKKKYFFA